MSWDRFMGANSTGARRFIITAFTSLAVILSASVAVQTVQAQDNNYTSGGGDPTDWFDPDNWDEAMVPPFGESTNIYEDHTVVIASGAASYGGEDLTIGSSDTNQTATLMITGGSLNGTDTGNDIRLGREDATLSGSLGRILQSGGDVTAVDYIKMSNAGFTNSAGSHYQISGGSLTIVDQLELGRDSGMVSTDSMIKFEVIGTGATSITMDDLKVNQQGLGSAQPTLAFTIDGTATGVTPLQIADEFQMGNTEGFNTPGVGELYLELSLSDVPTSDPIVLVQADRISMEEQFTDLPDGSSVSATFGPNEYTWTINYFDSSDDGVLVDAVVLSNLSVSPIVPEPASLTLLALVAFPLMLRRRRGN